MLTEDSYRHGRSRTKYDRLTRRVYLASIGYDPSCQRQLRRSNTLQPSVYRNIIVITLSLNTHTHQDCTCSTACQNCAVELQLNVSCSGDGTMDVTSDHIDVIRKQEWDGEYYEDGEEVAKRVENFGQPVGKGELWCSVGWARANAPQVNREINRSLSANFAKDNPFKYGVSRRRYVVGPMFKSLLEKNFVHRVLQKNMRSGRPAQPSRSSMTRTTAYATPRTGLKTTSRRSGRSRIMRRRRRHHETTSPSITTSSQINTTSASRRTARSAHRRW